MFGCDICSRMFSTKQMLEYHLVNNVCLQKNSGIKCPICDKGYQNEKWLKKHMVSCENSTKVSTGGDIFIGEVSTKSNLTCVKCNAKFNHKSSLSRHKSKYCKGNKNETNKSELAFYKQMFIENKEEKQQLEKEKQELIKLLMDKAGNTTINYNPSNFGNTTQSQVQNIKINGFGKEDLSYLTDGNKLKICDKVYGSVAGCIEDVHLNDKHPENRNIRIKNRQRNEIEKYDHEKQKWQITDLMEGVKDLITLNSDRVVDFFENGTKEKMSNSRAKRFESFMEDLSCETPEVMQRLIKDTKQLIKNSK
jgi:hypothetical protein